VDRFFERVPSVLGRLIQLKGGVETAVRTPPPPLSPSRAACRHWTVRGTRGRTAIKRTCGGQEQKVLGVPAKEFKTPFMNSAALHKCSHNSRLASSLSTSACVRLPVPSSRLARRSWTAVTTLRAPLLATRLYSAPSFPPSRLFPRRPTRPSTVTTPLFLGFPRHCSYEARRAKASRTADMSDRDILPDHFKPVHYDLILKDLDFSTWSYTGTVTSVPPLCSPDPLPNTSQHPRKGYQAYQGHRPQHARDQAPPRQDLRQQPVMGVDQLRRGQAVPAQHHHVP